MKRITVREVNRPVKAHHVAWSEKQKFHAAATYLLTQNWVITSNITGIPTDTLKRWSKLPWWSDLLLEVKRTQRAEQKGKLTKLVEKALSVVEDRLDNGDFVLNNKTGQITRKPVNAIVANKILGDSFDRNILLEKFEQEEVKKVTETEIINRLSDIQKAFEEMAKKKIRAPVVIDATEIKENAIHEERKEGLQTPNSVPVESQSSA